MPSVASCRALILSSSAHFNVIADWSCYFFHFPSPFFSSFSFVEFLFVILVIMSGSAQASSSGGRWTLTGGDTSSVAYRPPYDVTTYVRYFSSYSDTLQFFMLPKAISALCNPLEPRLEDMSFGAWHKRWKRFGKGVAPTLKKARVETIFR